MTYYNVHFQEEWENVIRCYSVWQQSLFKHPVEKNLFKIFMPHLFPGHTHLTTTTARDLLYGCQVISMDMGGQNLQTLTIV